MAAFGAKQPSAILRSDDRFGSFASDSSVFGMSASPPEAVAGSHGAAIKMVDTTIGRVHQHEVRIATNKE